MVRVILLPLAVLLLLASAACGDVFDRVALPEPTPAAIELSLTIAEPPADLPPYDRDDWRHWTDDDSDCQDTRQEVLVAESASRARFQDDRQCRVESGHWFDPYTGQVHTDPADLDVDHLVPLANAHRSGGWAWSSERKRQFANSLGDPAHLIAVSASANREKGARGPEEWRPPRMDYWCSYATAWARVKRAWDLTATRTEAEALREMLRTCDGPVSFEASGEVPVPVTVAPQPTPLPPGTYASCAEADASGEPRVKGARGDGWGFPAVLLPNSRDGDGDGVVCEVTLPVAEQPMVATATPQPLPSATPTFVPSATPVPRKTYTSCEEAEAAGEERVQGYIDGGLGFAEEAVPGARDGDGDGIVCEVDGPAPVAPTPPPSPPDATATPTPAPAPTPTPTVAPDGQRTYASCDEAEAAGEPRVRGSSGPGRGYPAELVPSARDGDGDGVVCER